jgi:acylphosphatase
VRETLVLLGRVDDPAFPPWIERRRRLLGLAGGLRARAPGRIEVEVEGAPDLLDAFELACSLGPAEVWVEATERLALPSADRP